MTDEKRQPRITESGRRKARSDEGAEIKVEAPEERRLTKRQVEYLSRATGFAASELADIRLGALADKLKYHLDWSSFFFQKVCGRVVKRDPVTGVLYPVPYATVHVEDTDCHLIFYSPSGLGYAWLYPFFCDREEIATVQTDECGNFCVYIPRWDIDRLLEWRRERICFPIFEPPRIIDILGDLLPDPGPLIRRPPLPDPPPDFSDFAFRREVETRLGSEVANRLALAAPRQTFGAFRGGLDAILMEPAPKSALPMPPLPDEGEVKRLIGDDPRLKKIGLPDLRRPIGPFKICYDVFVPVWQTIFDVPDVTFRVTQSQGGSDVTIYDESYFDVRWDDTSIPDVTLETWPKALTTHVCDVPPIECTNVPEILNIALMPLMSPYHDDTTGFGVRVNQPSDDGISAPAAGPAAGTANAPYADRLDLFGCFHIAGATHYRVVASFNGGTPQPILAGDFTVITTSFTLNTQPQLADGCYLIRNDLASSYEHLILGWLPADVGSYQITLQVGTLSGSVFTPTASSAPHTFEADGSYPVGTFNQIRWWHTIDGPGTATTLPAICPVIERDATKEVTVEVTWSASALHLRNAVLGMYGCGAGDPTPPALGDRSWYWQLPTDTSTGVKVAQFTIPSLLQAGCYTAYINAVSRAYNPAMPNMPLSADWYYPEDRRWTWPSRAISVVDA